MGVVESPSPSKVAIPVIGVFDTLSVESVLPELTIPSWGVVDSVDVPVNKDAIPGSDVESVPGCGVC